jgi:hypothetical protein
MCKLRHADEITVVIVLRDLLGSIRHYNRSPFAAIAGAVFMDAQHPGDPAGHAFSLNPNSGPVCPTCDLGVALFAGLFCICEGSISASAEPEVLACFDPW